MIKVDGVEIKQGQFPDHTLLMKFDPNSDEPQVLIVHTHTTESYMPYFDGTYREGEAARTDDPAANICAVGEAIADKLREAQLDPDAHKDIRVRITGYSGVFVDVCKRLQDDIIERFE